jgi:group I intron endonuclease
MLNFDCGIYAISSPDGKDYIGQAQSFTARWDKHRSELRKGRHHCKSLQQAFDRFGEATIRFKKIAIVPVEDLNRREQEQLDAWPIEARHNSNGRAHSGSRGLKRSEEFRKHCSERQKGKNAYWYGKKMPAATLEKLSKASKGRKLNEETRARMSASAKTRAQSDEHKARFRAIRNMTDHSAFKKSVVCIEAGVEFESLAAATEWIRSNGHPRASQGNISSACTGRSRKSYGYTWRYK